MHKSHFGVNNVVLFHHLVLTNGSFYEKNNTKEYGCFHGVGKSTAIPMMPDIKILCVKPKGSAIPVPSMTSLLACATIEDVNNLTNSTSVTFKPRNFIPVPPFLLKVVHESILNSAANAKEVLLEKILI